MKSLYGITTDVPLIVTVVPVHFGFSLCWFLVLREGEMEEHFDLTGAFFIRLRLILILLGALLFLSDLMKILIGAKLKNLEVVNLLVLHRLFEIDFHLRESCDYIWVQSWHIWMHVCFPRGSNLRLELGCHDLFHKCLFLFSVIEWTNRVK